MSGADHIHVPYAFAVIDSSDPVMVDLRPFLAPPTVRPGDTVRVHIDVGMVDVALNRRSAAGGPVPRTNPAIVPVDGHNPCGRVSVHEPHLIGTLAAPVQCLGKGGYDG